MASELKKFLLVLGILAPLALPAQNNNEMWESKGPHVRIKRNDKDGTYVEFKRDPEDRKLIKTTKDANGKILMSALYYRNDKGFLTSGDIRDAHGTSLFRVRYGYSAKNGQLIAEEMFDNQVKRFFPGTRKEMPLRRIYYFYDAQGNQSRALSLVPRKGKMAEEIYDPENSTRPDQNPFDLEKQQQGN
ncbi:MAG: hypothetical protein ACQKBY_01995 [Verrucomicrobiales bacterium]